MASATKLSKTKRPPRKMSGRIGTPTNDDLVLTAERMKIPFEGDLSKLDQRTQARIVRQATIDNLYIRGARGGRSTWEKQARATPTNQLGAGTGIDDITRGAYNAELVRRSAPAKGPSVTMMIDGKSVTFDPRNGGFRRHKAALGEIKSGRVSFDPSATRGLSEETVRLYDNARKDALTKALDALDKDPTFKKPGNWGEMSQFEQLGAYGKHLAETTGNTQVKTYSQLKSEWLSQRQEAEAARRRKLEDKANPGQASPPPGGAPSFGTAGGKSIVNVDDLQYGGSPSQTPAERRRQAEKDSAEFGSYYHANFQAIEQQRKLERAQQQLEIERRKLARRYTEMATYVMRTGGVGLGGTEQ